MKYHRAKTPGATYFFTVVTYQRQHLFHSREMVNLLRAAFHSVKTEHPFAIDAIVILPDHIHCIWTLPKGDANFSLRWQRIKSKFSRLCPESYNQERSASRLSKGEQAIWQRRFWEHQIRDEVDFTRHVDYIHYNPMKHHLVKKPRDWQYSSFHTYVRNEIYSEDWGAEGLIELDRIVGSE
jgi:putative transposase